MAYSDPVKKAAAARRWRLSHVAQIKEAKAKWRKEWKERHKNEAREQAKTDSLRYRETNPLKDKARAEVRKALRNGTLVKGPCEVCGESRDVEAHHVDYFKPLEIVWLCKKHHLELHEGQAFADLTDIGLVGYEYYEEDY